jgi:putative flippase GtrA
LNRAATMTEPSSASASAPTLLSTVVERLSRSRVGRLALQFGKFGMVGIVGFAVDVAVLYLLLANTNFGHYGARAISFLTAATTTWTLNRNFTFRGEHDGTLWRQWAKFVAANSFGGLLNYGTYAALVAYSPLVAAHPILGVAAGSIVGMFFNFTAAKKLVFKVV